MAVTTAGVVPFGALHRQHAPIAAELREAFDRVIGASAFVLGSEVERFEDSFAASCEVSHCVGVSSGTSALAIALRAAGIGPGDEVIVPAHTFIASALAVVHAGATPVFCDVEHDTALIDPESASAAVTERTAAIICVHLYGQSCDMRTLRRVAGRHGLLLIEDAAQAHGATYGAECVGALGDVSCFSFYPSKNLGALGDGGAICTSNEELAQRARAFRNLGQRAKGEHVVTGSNDRLHGMQAAMLSVKLPYLQEYNAARREHAARYRELLPAELRVVAERPLSPSVHHLFCVRVADRDEFATRLSARGVQTGIHYDRAVHRHPPFASARIAPEGVPQADAWAAQTLSLPMFPELRAGEIEQVAEACALSV